MPKSILGIQLTETEAMAAYLKWGWKGATVDRVIRVELPPRGDESRGEALLTAGLPYADTVVTALPSDEVFQRTVKLPFADRNKIVQAAPLEAEESLPFALEELVCHVHLLRRETWGTTALLAAAPRDSVAGLLGELRAAGLDPQIVDVEALALVSVARGSLGADAAALVVDLSPRMCQGVIFGPAGKCSFCVFSASSRDPSLLSEVSRYLARWRQEGWSADAVFLCGPDALTQSLEDWLAELELPVRILPIPEEVAITGRDGAVAWPGWAVPLGLALREGHPRTASQINLRQGPFALRTGAGPWKGTLVRLGVYLLLLLALWGVGAWSEVSYANARYRSLSGSIREAFRRALPDVKNIVSELDQMRVRVEELEGKAQSLGSLVDREVSALRILREVSARMPQDLEVEFRDFVLEEGKVRIEGVTTSFDAIDRIKADLAAFARFGSVTVSDAKAGVERDKVLFKLAITLGRKG